jgi:sn-glycerol 3-phosphate transport system substrate-binding protein
MFYSQECAMYMNSSAGRAGVINNAKAFKVGFAPLPYYDDVITQPLNSIIGGATLWTLKGRPEEEYKGVAKFFTYLQKPEVQADWHQFSGYLPITEAAYKLGQDQGYYEKNPGADIGIKQLTRVIPTDNSKGIRFGNYVQVRGIIDDEFAALLGGKKTAKEAVDSVVARGNEQLRDFQSAN